MELPKPLLEIPGVSAEAWAELPPSAQAIILAIVGHYEHRIAAYEERIEKYEQRICDLEVRLKQNSSNSSKPPSSDAFKKHGKKKKPSGNPQGGQPGHQGHCRAFVPAEKVDATKDYSPVRCEHCGDSLDEADAIGDPERHQISELSPITPIITEHKACDRRCKRCGNVSKGRVPTPVKQSAFGPRVHALAGILTGRYRLSRRDAAECFDQLFGLTICSASIQRILEFVSRSLEPGYAQALEAVRKADVRHFDETSWPLRGKRGWLWIGVTACATVFKIAPSRGRIVLIEWIGEATFLIGYIVSDRYSVYKFVSMEQRGICHAHIRRDFQKMADCGDAFVVAIGACLVRLHEAYFTLRHRLETAAITREEFLERLLLIKQEMHDVLERGANASNKAMSGLCANLLQHWSAFWTHLNVPGMEPTNNAAERGLRPAVVWRTLCFGTKSIAGGLFVERMLTVLQTCRQNAINVRDYITQTVEATLQGTLPPALLPALVSVADSS